MEEVLALIEKIIEEHKLVIERVQTLEKVANDASTLLQLGKAKDDFMPGRLDQGQSLQKLEESLEIIDKGLQAHFEGEETALLAAFEKHGDKMLVSALHFLLLEHEDLRKRFVQSKEEVTKLAKGELSHHLWEASAHDMRAHISHTRKLLETHAYREQELLKKLHNHLRKENERK